LYLPPFPVRSVIALPQAEQKQMPVSSVGPLTIRGAVRAGLEQRLHRLERGRINDRRHRHLDDLGVGLPLTGLGGAHIELMASDIGLAGEHLAFRATSKSGAYAADIKLKQ
jgi:hypothetical protein